MLFIVCDLLPSTEQLGICKVVHMVCEAIVENLLEKYAATLNMLFKDMKEYGDFRTAVARLVVATFRKLTW